MLASQLVSWSAFQLFVARVRSLGDREIAIKNRTPYEQGSDHQKAEMLTS
jgi:hypothetical protein